MKLAGGLILPKSATAAAGYRFQMWQPSASASIDNTSSASANVTLTGDATLEAMFIEIPATAALTVAASPAEGGF